MLTKKQLKQLRNEITLNSLFLKDYNNSLFIKEKTVCNFFEGYVDYLYEMANDNTVVIFDLIDKYDNIDNLYNYYLMCCVEEYDPLLQNDYIAVKNISYYNGVVIYNVDDYKVITASYYIKGLSNNMIINKITKNSIYYDNVGDPYIKKDGYKYYLSEFIKVNE